MTEKPLVLLTNPIHEDAAALLQADAELVTAPDTEADTLRRLAGAVAGIVVRAKLPDDILDHAPNLRGIVRHGVGLDFIPVEAATARGVPVANLPGSNTQAVAEYALSMLLQLHRPLVAMDAAHREEGWDAARRLTGEADEIGGTTLGILGLGAIGQRIARIASQGFGMTVLGTPRRRGTAPDGIEEVDREALFARSDAVVIACALTEETRGLVDARSIGLMKPDAVLINVARGPIVDTGALVAALRGGRLRGAASDVYDVHPAPRDSPLFGVPNLLVTPHVAALTASSAKAMGLGAVQEMLRMLRGERPVNLVNPQALAR